jgi:hypothetical protein
MLSTTGPGTRDWTSRLPLQPGARAISNVDLLCLLVLWAMGCKNPNNMRQTYATGDATACRRSPRARTA